MNIIAIKIQKIIDIGIWIVASWHFFYDQINLEILSLTKHILNLSVNNPVVFDGHYASNI